MTAKRESDTVVTTVKPEHVTKTERSETVTFLEAVSEGLFEEMVADDTVFLIGEDIGVYGGAFKVTRGFLDYFGEKRVIDTPIVEGGFTGAAAGAAHMGLRPVVEMQFMDFISPAYDEERHPINRVTPLCPTNRAGALSVPG